MNCFKENLVGLFVQKPILDGKFLLNWKGQRKKCSHMLCERDQIFLLLNLIGFWKEFVCDVEQIGEEAAVGWRSGRKFSWMKWFSCSNLGLEETKSQTDIMMEGVFTHVLSLDSYFILEHLATIGSMMKSQYQATYIKSYSLHLQLQIPMLVFHDEDTQSTGSLIRNGIWMKIGGPWCDTIRPLCTIWSSHYHIIALVIV